MSKKLEDAINAVLDSFLFERLNSNTIPYIIEDISKFMEANGFDKNKLHVIDNGDTIVVTVDDPILNVSIKKHN